jgi:transglutaminase-like putative cysteine protease
VTARYRIEHETRYVYATTVATSQHVAYLRPRELPCQHVLTADLIVTPAPRRVLQRTDYFGNLVEQFELLKPHEALRVQSRSVVDVHGPETAIDPANSMSWTKVRDALAGSRAQPDISQFVYPSPHVPPTAPGVAEFARESFPDGRTLAAGAMDLMRRIHEGFRFDPSATSVMTPVRQVLADRRGVCQDFAHLQVACLRSLGLAARYVSGYLLTDPPPGQPRLIGADASHAWVSVHCPTYGWIDLDPTNGVRAAERHVTVAWGRDFGDVSPLRGVLLGGEHDQLIVGVSVVPIAADQTGESAAPPSL